MNRAECRAEAIRSISKVFNTIEGDGILSVRMVIFEAA